MPLQTASAVGIPSKTAWSTTAFRRTSVGEIYVACGFSGTDKAPHKGREFIHWFEEHTFESPAQLYQHLKQYWDDLDDEVAASISLVFFQEGHITAFSFGFSMVGLVRDNHSRWLISGKQNEQVLEGEIQFGDRLILATARALEDTPELESWESYDADAIAGDLFSRVQKNPATSELAYSILLWENPTQQSLTDEAPRYSLSDSSGRAHGVPSERQFFLQHQTVFEPDTTSLEEEIEESPPVSAAPVQSASAHLIAPEKIAAGIVATQEAQTQRIKKQKITDTLFHFLAKLQQLSWFRIVIALLILGGVFGGLMLWRQMNIGKEYNTIIVPLQSSVQEVQMIPADQRLQQRDAAKSLLEKLQATRVEYRQNRTKLVELTTSIEQLYQGVSGEKDLVNLPIYYDFRLVVANFLATRADRFEDQAIFLDANEKKLITLNLSSKSNKTVVQEALADGKDIVAEAQNAFVLKNKTVEQIPFSGDDASTVADLKDVSEAAFLERFGSNLYVLDTAKQQLWRMNREDQEASPSGWVRSAPGVDFASATSLAIDGDVWLGTNKGNIYRLSRGTRVDFSIDGLLQPFTSSLLVAAVEEGQKLVVVEPSQNRLVVLSKDGVYQQQVSSEQIGGVTDVFLSADETAAYLVAGSVVYKVEM